MLERAIHPKALEQIEEFEEYLVEIGRSYYTVKGYTHDLRDFAIFLREPLWPEPANLDAKVQRWLSYRRQIGDALMSLRRRIYSIKSYYHYAGIPDALSSVVSPRCQFYLPKILTNAEVERLFSELQHADPVAFDFFRLILLVGMRLDEVHAIKPTPEQIEKRRVLVQDDKGREREVVIGDQAALILTAFLERGCQWNRPKSRLIKTLELCAAMAGVKKATTLTIRATCAARMMVAGHKPEFVKTNLGYRSDRPVSMIRKVAASELMDGVDF